LLGRVTNINYNSINNIEMNESLNQPIVNRTDALVQSSTSQK